VEQGRPPTQQRGHDVWASVAYWSQPSDKIVALSKSDIRTETHATYRGQQVWNKPLLSNLRGYSRLKRFNPDLVVISQRNNIGGFEWARACRNPPTP
jgi:hypothetical protein